MFAKSQKAVEAKLDEAAERVLDAMLAYGPEEPQYETMLERLERVENLRKPKGSKREIDWNNVILVAGNLLGILTIVAYEQKHVMTSKGLGFILKSK